MLLFTFKNYNFFLRSRLVVHPDNFSLEELQVIRPRESKQEVLMKEFVRVYNVSVTLKPTETINDF